MWGSFLNENHSGLVTGCEEGGNKSGPRMLLGILGGSPLREAAGGGRWEGLG